MWYNLAVSRFSTSDNENRDFAINLRNGLVAKMTSAQIAEAQKLAREWRPKLANGAPTQAFQRGVLLKMDGGIFGDAVTAMASDGLLHCGVKGHKLPPTWPCPTRRAVSCRKCDAVHVYGVACLS
jgi:hypothetical protein